MTEEMNESWTEYKRLVVDSLSRLDHQYEAMNTKLDKKFDELNEKINKLSTKLTVLETKAYVLGTLGGVVITAIFEIIIGIIKKG